MKLSCDELPDPEDELPEPEEDLPELEEELPELWELEEELPESGEDVTTDVQESDIENSGIDIYTEGNKIVVSSTSDVELQTIMISDISGRHQVYNVSGRYVTIDLPVSTGVYTIYAIGDKDSRTEKLKLN